MARNGRQSPSHHRNENWDLQRTRSILVFADIREVHGCQGSTSCLTYPFLWYSRCSGSLLPCAYYFPYLMHCRPPIPWTRGKQPLRCLQWANFTSRTELFRLMGTTDRELMSIVSPLQFPTFCRAVLVNGVFPAPLIQANKVRLITMLESRSAHLYLFTRPISLLFKFLMNSRMLPCP